MRRERTGEVTVWTKVVMLRAWIAFPSVSLLGMFIVLIRVGMCLATSSLLSSFVKLVVVLIAVFETYSHSHISARASIGE